MPVHSEIEGRLKNHEIRISNLEERTARIGKEAREAFMLSQRANQGYAETYNQLKSIKEKTDKNEMKLDEILTRISSNNKWFIGVILTILGLIISNFFK